MRFFEYEAKELFKSFGIPVPRGAVAASASEATRIAREMARPVVLKAQTLAGRRGKAGLIAFASGPEEVDAAVKRWIRLEIDGVEVRRVLVEERVDIRREMYLAIMVDRVSRRPLIIASPVGGVEVEEIAAEAPEKILKQRVDLWLGLRGYHIRAVAKHLGVQERLVGEVLKALYSLFRRCDGILVEVNPLALTGDGSLLAVDAKLEIDEFALYRHPEFQEKVKARRLDLVDVKLREAEAREGGISAYVELDGEIGILSNGASLGMEAMDIVADLGGRPACFCDVGGGQEADEMKYAVSLILSNPRVKVLLVNVLGGLTRCDYMAQGIAGYLKESEAKVPVVVRLTGIFEDEGKAILKEIGIEAYDSLMEAAKKAVDLLR